MEFQVSFGDPGSCAGIAPERIEALADPFTQDGSTTTRAKVAPAPAAPIPAQVDGSVGCHEQARNLPKKGRNAPMDARAEALAALAGAGDSPLMRSFPQGAIFTWDHELRYLSAGGYGLADVGLSREMLEGHTIFEAFPPETASAIEPNFRAALRGESTTIDVPYGGHVYSLHISPIRDRDGNIVAGMGFTQDVTDVRGAETALRESEERARLSFEHAPIGQALVELDGRWRQVNSALTRLTGYTDSELLGMTFQDITHPDDLDADLAYVEQLLAGTIDSYQMEKRYLTATGATVWVLLTGSLVRSEDGIPLYFIAQIQDINERKRTEQALQASEERLQLLVDSTPDYAMVMLDAQGRIGTWNAGAQRVKGFSEAEVLGRHFSLLYIEEDRAAGLPQRDLDAAAATGRHEEEGWRLRKDGSQFWANVIITAVRAEDGRLRGFSKVTRDLTERRRSETRFEGLLEAAPDALIGVEADGQIHLVNTQTERLFGYPRDEMLGSQIATLVPGWSLVRRPHAHTAHHRTGPQVGSPPAKADLSGRRKDGTEFPAEITMSPIETQDDFVVTAAIRDVTQRRAFEAEVAAARDLAEKSARFRQEFLANMSHEIRTPMNAVIAMTSLLLDTTLDDQQRDHMQTVRTSGEHLLTIINDVLDYAKIDAGKLVLEELAFEIRPWLRDTLDLITAQAQKMGLEILCDVDPQAPAVVTGDPGRLRQILVNLLSNAVKFTQAGEVTVRVCLDDARPEQDWLLITVSDTGVGIAPERIEALFDPFTQADSTTTRVYGGTGLGLAISRRLATAMGGEITMDSTPGAGTTVCLNVPVETTTVAAAPHAPATAVPGPLAGRRMLIVDDNAASRSMLETWSRRHQMTCVSATNAEQALRLVEDDQDFACALIDLAMPGMNGAELGALLSARLPATHLILLSSVEPDGRRPLPDVEHFDAVMAKPVDQDRLFDLLGTLQATGAVPKQPRAAQISAFALPGTTRDLSILVVEDQAVNQKVAQHLLTRFGFRAEVAASGLEAIAALEQRDYDLVLMDVQMPDMDGLEATRLIRSRWPLRPVQIVAMTANVAPEDVRRCHAAGMDHFLGKPITVPALAHILSAFTAPAPPAVMTQTEEHPIDDLRDRLGHEVVQELVSMFLADLDLAIPTLTADYRAHDRAALAHAAHGLKSSARMLGAQPLGELLHELEQLAPAAKWPELENLVTRVQAQRQPTHDALTARLR